MSGVFRGLAMRRVTRKPDDAEQALETVVHPLSGPNECISSSAAIDQRGQLSLPGRSSGPMPDQRCFAEAGFVVGERDDDHLRLSEVFHRPESRSTSKRLDSSWLESKLGGSQVTKFARENAASGS